MSEDEQREFVLSQLRGESLRAKLYDADIISIGIALKGGFITSIDAVNWMREIGTPETILKKSDEVVKGCDDG